MSLTIQRCYGTDGIAMPNDILCDPNSEVSACYGTGGNICVDNVHCISPAIKVWTPVLSSYHSPPFYEAPNQSITRKIRGVQGDGPGSAELDSTQRWWRASAQGTSYSCAQARLLIVKRLSRIEGDMAWIMCSNASF